MSKLLQTFFAILVLSLASYSVKAAELRIGAALMVGSLDSDGAEHEDAEGLNNAAGTTDKNTKSFSEAFEGGSIFAEIVGDNGFAIGLDYVPASFDIGSGSRVDTTAANDDDAGTRTASAELEDLMTVYTKLPIGGGGFYGILGMHFADITTSETLPNATYGNEKIYGGQIGLGYNYGNFSLDVFYSDFQDITLNSTSGKSFVTADADATTLRLAYGF
tara:strand:- start:457 stop:1110 length:654 start_codon:yes stop_codon:yes gene_type:complete